MSHGSKRVAGLCAGLASTIALTLNGVSVAHAAEGQVLGTGAPGAIDGSYIVTLHETPAVSTMATNLAEQYDGTVSQIYSAALHGFSVRMTERQARRLAADPAVRHVEQNAMAHATEIWGLDRVDQRDLPLDNAFTAPNDGSGVKAYVLDTGVDFNHPDFGGRATSGYDFIDNDSDASDCHGHGTHVAGTIGGRTHGVAKNVELVSVRVLDCNSSGPWDKIIAGIDWVTRNAPTAAVGNMSLGGSRTTSVDTAVANSVKAGVAWAVAAGNAGQNACNYSPAAAEGVLTVGATDSADKRSVWSSNSASNYGSCVELFAPGTSITSSTWGGGTGQMSGTSMATPHVAGGLVLATSATPGIAVADANAKVLDTATTNKVTDPKDSPNRLLYVDDLGTHDPGAPKASFTATCSSTTPSCTFDASASTDPDGSISSYAWEFGDGTTGTGIKPAHTYNTPGAYTAKLTVTDNTGKTATTSRRVQAGPQPPTASFTVYCYQARCDFDATASTDPDGDIATYTWNFGDGTTGTGVKLQHTYPPRTATYTPQLVVTDRTGGKGSTTKQIQCNVYGSLTFCFAQYY